MPVLYNAVPLLLAGLGALVSELAGSLCIAVEGFMTMGAFFSWLFAYATGYVWLGTVLAVLLAGLAGLGLAVLVEKTRANPFVAGLAFNLLASGLAGSISGSLFHTRGALTGLAFPADSGIGWLLLAVMVLCSTSYIIRWTSVGLCLRCVGLSGESVAFNEGAAFERGIESRRYRVGAWTLCAVLSALAGAAVTWSVGAYIPGGIAGRSWIAIALVFLGFKKAWGVGLAALVLSAAELAVISLQGRVGPGFPITILLGIPQALALVLYAASTVIGKRRPND
jgi:simple sugar transport system permease protein